MSALEKCGRPLAYPPYRAESWNTGVLWPIYAIPFQSDGRCFWGAENTTAAHTACDSIDRLRPPRVGLRIGRSFFFARPMLSNALDGGLMGRREIGQRGGNKNARGRKKENPGRAQIKHFVLTPSISEAGKTRNLIQKIGKPKRPG